MTDPTAPALSRPISIACIGAAHLDSKATLRAKVDYRTTNEARIHSSDGGVARNIAETIARLGGTVRLVSVVGTDDAGEGVIARVAAHGVDVGLVTRVPNLPTASYSAILDKGGGLILAIADMAIYDQWTPAQLAPLLPELTQQGIWVVDTNLPADTLRWLFDHKPASTALVVDGVSNEKTLRIATLLDRIDLLFCNRDQASTLAGRSLSSAADVMRLGHQLAGAGVGAAIATWGKAGLYLLDRRGAHFMPAPRAEAVDVTGAGDSLIATTVTRMSMGDPLETAIRLGQAAAALTVEVTDSVRQDLTLDLLRARVDRRS
jgi:pseudouridine kinase